MTQASRPVRGPRFYQTSTAHVPARDRFDYWRSLFGGARLAPLGDRAQYNAHLAGCDGDDDMVFTAMACAPTAADYAGQDNSHLRMSIVTHGALHVTDSKDHRTVFHPGHRLALLDASRPGWVDSPTGYRALHLTLPRPLVLAALGGDPTSGALLRDNLPTTTLSTMLTAQLDVLARQGARMDTYEVSKAMQTVSALATAYLGQLRDKAGEPTPEAAMFTSACALIDQWKADPALSAQRVARALGCSRANLARLFERHGIRIGAYIRQRRLAYGKQLLRDPALDVGEVARRAGYAGAQVFDRAFRHRYGLSPRDWKQLCHETRTAKAAAP